jgi:hypothetical protein
MLQEMNKLEIYSQLYDQRELVIDPYAGHVVQRDAWAEIDRLLDQLNILNLVGVTLEEASE